MKSLKKILLLTTLVIFALSFSFSTSPAQDSTEVPEPETYELEGEVVDNQTGTILADAEISIAGQDIKTVTDEEGKFKLESLPAGEHTLKVTLEGYEPWEKKIVLEEDTERTIYLDPEKT